MPRAAPSPRPAVGRSTSRPDGEATRAHLLDTAGQVFAERGFAVASVLTPFFLGAALGGIAAGRVPLGNAQGDPITSWLNPVSLIVGALAVVICAYTAAVFLVADAGRVGDEDLARAFTRRATVTAVVAGIVAVAGLVVLRDDAPYIGGRLAAEALPLVLVSALAGGANLYLLHRGVRRWTRPLAVVAVAAVVGAASGDGACAIATAVWRTGPPGLTPW